MKKKNEMNSEIIAMKKARTERRNENHRLTIKHPIYLFFFSCWLIRPMANAFCVYRNLIEYAFCFVCLLNEE